MVVVTFRSRLRADADMAALEALGLRMYELASQMPGFISYKDFAAADGETLTLVEFESEETLLAWRNQAEHRAVQERARREFFSAYEIVVASPYRAYRYTTEAGRVEMP